LNTGETAAITLNAGGQTATFIHQIFPQLGTSFVGTAFIQSNAPIGVTALRGTLDGSASFIMTAVPISAEVPAGDITAFPQVADGDGYSTEMVLINPATTPIRGVLQLSFTASTDRGDSSRFTYEIPAHGVWKLQTRNVPVPTQTGFGVITPDSGNTRPIADAI